MINAAKLEVSIGICAYNEAKNIGYLLQSVIGQITKDILISEVIVVSDGSLDATNSIVEAAKRQRDIKLIALDKRSGKYAAINAFLKAARSEVLVLASADLILDPCAIEHLCRPFLNDPYLGMTGARPRPKNTKDIFLGYLAHLLWDLHHQLALIQPKFGELVAFKNIIRDIPATLVDEEELAALVKDKKYSLRYVPDSVVYNKGPMFVRDFLRQRRRIYAGHLMLKKRYSYDAATVNAARIIKCLFKKEIRVYTKRIHWLAASVALEGIGRFLGWRDACFNRSNYLWPIAESTKELCEVHRPTSYHIDKNVGIYKKSEHIRLIKKWAGSLKGKSVLKTDLYEEAFGNDSFVAWLKSQGAYVYGADISKNIVLQAGSHCSLNAASDLRNCGFKSGSFDVIVSNSTLDNLKERDVPQALKEIRRMIKDDGILLLTLDNAHNPLYVFGYMLEKILKTNNHYQSRCYSINEATSLAKESGFFVEDVDAIVHLPTPFNKAALCLSKTNIAFFNRISRRLIVFFARFAKKRTRASTGWFIALKCRPSK